MRLDELKWEPWSHHVPPPKISYVWRARIGDSLDLFRSDCRKHYWVSKNMIGIYQNIDPITAQAVLYHLTNPQPDT
jgi:hypothetical protein